MNLIISLLVFPVVVPICIAIIGTMATIYAIGMTINGGRLED